MHRARSDHLSTISQLIDTTYADEPGHVLVYLREPRTEINLWARSSPVGVHPFEVLAGFSAPADSWAFGIRARGRAHHLDEPGRVTEEITATFLVDRHGQEASVLRVAEVATVLTGPVQGTIADLCRRVLGVPTPPAPATTNHFWATRWLDAVLAEWADPERRRATSACLGALTALHPATGGKAIEDLSAFATLAHEYARRWSWSALRDARPPLSLPNGPLPPAISTWMDDGFFARWSLGAYPSLDTLAHDLCGLLGTPLGPQLLAAVMLILEPSPTGTT